MRFRDRNHAATLLADRVYELMIKNKESAQELENSVVLGLPRGGLPLAAALAKKLKCELDIIVPRKIGVPNYEEYACGAITPSGYRVIDEETVQRLHITSHYLEQKSAEEQQTATQRETMLRGGRAAVSLQGRIVFLVDDGIATGMTMRAAIGEVLNSQPKKIIIATPVIAADTLQLLTRTKGVHQVIVLLAPNDFRAVGLWYERFDQLEDAEAKRILHLYWADYEQNKNKDRKPEPHAQTAQTAEATQHAPTGQTEQTISSKQPPQQLPPATTSTTSSTTSSTMSSTSDFTFVEATPISYAAQTNLTSSTPKKQI